MIQDKDTNIVYFSSKLSEWKNYRDFYRELVSLLDELGVRHARLYDTKDIWARDYMPVQLEEDVFLKYRYEPDYLKNNEKWRPYITDCTRVCDKLGIHCRETDIVIDGGNVVLCGDKVVMTQKVFAENNKAVDDVHFLRQLEELFGHRVVIIPWHVIDPSDSKADIYGHSDGFVKYCGNDRILMGNHRDFDENEAIEIRRILEDNGYQVTEMLFDVEHPQWDWNWAYINFLQVGDNIILPKFDIAEDEQARSYVQAAFPYCRVRQIDCRVLADVNVDNGGGALHCISWNIKR